LAVRFGIGFVRYEIAGLLFAAYAFSTYWVMGGYFLAAVLPLLTLPLGFKLVTSVMSVEPSPRYNGFLAQSGALLLGFGLLISVGFVLG
jgi:hypothetical protein